MGEIIDLEHYRKLRLHREADAEKAAADDPPDVQESEDPSTPAAVKRAGPGHTGPKGTAKTGGDDLKSD